ncbi:hypothetical protein PHISCL_04060 [Aspergillus sclerotialis]|uniref:Aminotransferase class I/classII large domain-containing protein n=1 Tax=Aspergillus sclerotialis TaxID=2070753 RepID=A0A3A2ZWB9_9EURO|nr:hypothetical protein PHISCL_04060 [Aspergillus sclerotialis]
MKLCNRYRLHLISDEIYGLSVWDNPKVKDNVGFTSVLSIDAAQFMDPSMVHVVWGLSKKLSLTNGLNKDFGATGIRMGCLISQENRAFLDSAEGISLFNFPSSLADNITAKLLTDDQAVDRFVSLNQSRLAESYQFVTNFLRKHGIPYRESNACLFVWVNLAAAVKGAPLSDEDILSKLSNEKVYVTSGSTYACEEEGWFRFVIAHPRNVLDEGLRRIASAVL